MPYFQARGPGLAFVQVHAAHRIFHHVAKEPRRRQLHPALGVDEEIAGDHDALTGLQTLDDFYPISQAPPGLNPARLEITVAPVDKNDLLEP